MKRGRCETSGEGEWKIFTDNQGVVVDFVPAEDENRSNAEGTPTCRSSRYRAITFRVI